MSFGGSRVLLVLALVCSDGGLSVALGSLPGAFGVMKEMLAPISEAVVNEECRNHSALYLEELAKSTLWAVEMFDASTKFPSGIFAGSQYDFGNFDECLDVNASSSTGSFAGKYCLATFTFLPKTPDPIKNLSYAFDRKYDNESVWYATKIASRLNNKRPREISHCAFCIPSTCNEDDLERHLQNVTASLEDTLNFEITVNIHSCKTKPATTLDHGDIIFLYFVCYVAIFAVACTLYDIAVSKPKLKSIKLAELPHRFILCFSLKRNFLKLVEHKEDDKNFDIINGFRFLSICFTLLGHRAMFVGGSPVVNTAYLENNYYRWYSIILTNGPIIVNSFFCIAGFLTSYLLMVELDRQKGKFNYFHLVFHRLIRLTPLYATVIFFYSTLFYKLGSGPLWDMRVGAERERCRKNWWTNILYINNFIRPGEMCMFQSWYLSADMQMFIIGTLLTYFLWRYGKRMVFIIVLSIVLSIAYTFKITYENNLNATMMTYTRVIENLLVDRNFVKIYSQTVTRIPSYFAGILTGYARYRIHLGKTRIPQAGILILWLCVVVGMTATFFSCWLFYQPDRPFDRLGSAVYGSLHHFAWSFLLSWGALAITIGKGYVFDDIFGWKPFLILNRLTFAMYVCHGAIQMYDVAIQQTPVTFSIFHIVKNCFGDIVMSIVIGTCLSILFESPVIGLEKLLLGKK